MQSFGGRPRMREEVGVNLREAFDSEERDDTFTLLRRRGCPQPNTNERPLPIPIAARRDEDLLRAGVDLGGRIRRERIELDTAVTPLGELAVAHHSVERLAY